MNPSLNLFRDTIQTQRHRWATQRGNPPIKESRAQLPWEPWEQDLLIENRDTMTVAELATWTGRTTQQIHQQFNDYDMMADDPDPDFDDEDFGEMSRVVEDDPPPTSKKKTIAAKPLKDPPMSQDDTLIQAYHQEYIGRSAGLSGIAEKHHISPIALKELWIKNNLRLRNRSQSYAARKQSGDPWHWPDQPKAPPAAEPVEAQPVEAQPVEAPASTNGHGHLQLTEADVTRIYLDLYIGQSIGLTECATYLGVNYIVLKEWCDKLGLQLRDKSEVAIARHQRGQPWRWDYLHNPPAPTATNGNITLPPNLAALIQELKALNIPVEVSISIQLHIKE